MHNVRINDVLVLRNVRINPLVFFDPLLPDIVFLQNPVHDIAVAAVILISIFEDFVVDDPVDVKGL